jgi:hypothetical protein
MQLCASMQPAVNGIGSCIRLRATQADVGHYEWPHACFTTAASIPVSQQYVKITLAIAGAISSSVQAYSPSAKQQHNGLAPGLSVFKLHTVSATTAVHRTRSGDHSSGQCILKHKQLQPGSHACAVNQTRNKPATRAVSTQHLQCCSADALAAVSIQRKSAANMQSNTMNSPLLR